MPIAKTMKCAHPTQPIRLFFRRRRDRRPGDAFRHAVDVEVGAQRRLVHPEALEALRKLMRVGSP
jgi:hypothetical protein